MTKSLTQLTESDVQARCTEAVLGRGWSYYTGGAIRQRTRMDDGLQTHVSGTHVYRVSVRETSGGLWVTCTCPYNWGGDCKHIIATLLAWLHEPESFHAAGDVQAALAARSKKELVAILADVCAVYPHLVDEFNLFGEATEYDPEAVVKKIFSALHPPGDIDIDAGVSRMETVARHAGRLAQQGQGDVARRAYYVLVRECVSFCEDYGAHDVFPLNIPYDFVIAYQELALDQLEEHSEAIMTEVRRMLRGDWATEMLGIQDPLIEIEAVLLDS